MSDILRLEFFAESAMWYSTIRLYGRDRSFGRVANIEPVIFKTPEEGELCKPFLQLTLDQATELMDCLWGCGIRPSNGEGSSGQLSAVKYHLEDMRSLVFGDAKKGAQEAQE